MNTRWTLQWAALPLSLLAALAGCNVGVVLGIGPGDDPPSVSLAVAPQEAAAGATIELVAAASDDYVVKEVRFYRDDAAGPVLLGRDTSEPYALQTALPLGAEGEVHYFARAEDDAGQVTESAVAIVTVQ